MFVFDLCFHFSPESEDFDYALTDYLRALSGNNQIIFETLNISSHESERVARVTVPYEDSLDETHYDSYAKEALQRLLPHLTAPISTVYVGEDFTYKDEFATGEDADHYVLCIHPHLRDLTPILCGHSKRYIPRYFLPPLSEETTRELTSWDTAYGAYDRLFYATGIGEMSSHKMLSNMSSRLNQKGLRVCRLLEQEWNKPVYYYLYRFYGKHPSKCPVCKGDWEQDEGSLFDYKCDACKIVADKTGNE